MTPAPWASDSYPPTCRYDQIQVSVHSVYILYIQGRSTGTRRLAPDIPMELPMASLSLVCPNPK